MNNILLCRNHSPIKSFLPVLCEFALSWLNGWNVMAATASFKGADVADAHCGATDLWGNGWTLSRINAACNRRAGEKL